MTNETSLAEKANRHRSTTGMIRMKYWLRKFIAHVGLLFTPVHWVVSLDIVHKYNVECATHGLCGGMVWRVQVIASLVMAIIIFGIGVGLWRRLDDWLRGRPPLHLAGDGAAAPAG